jgi:phosphoribosylformimino-5-aminoimidazole carboxamide ribonucleotide (ProFAR) isomerase
MLAIPQLEIRHGLCVRPSVNGNGEAGVAMGGGGVGVARGWAYAGFRRVHVLDVDAATGSDVNSYVIDDIIRDGSVEVQAHCGAESTDDIDRLISAGACHVIVGPRALDEPEWLAGVASEYPGFLVVATDVRERRVVTRGWVRSLPLDIFDVVEDLCGLPLGGLLVSSPATDGSRSNSDLALLEDVALACDFSVIAAGGVSTMNDLRALEHRGVAAVLLGEALYTGQLDARGVASEYGE